MQDAQKQGLKQVASKKSEYKSHREYLKAISAFAKILVKEGAAESVNAVILEQYADQGHEDLATIGEWNKRGYSIKKGSRALPIWARPKALKKKGEQQPKPGTEEDESSFFPICYLFSSAMVERRQPKP
jgi:hypothetical protein